MSQPSTLISFILPTYNQAPFIGDSVRGVLNQTYSPLEIIISDDCSKDSTFDIVKDILDSYKGPHQVVLNRNETNKGIAGNISRALSLVHGDLIIVNAGDDIAMPNKAEEIYNAWRNTDFTAMAFFSNAIVINSKGEDCGLYFKSKPRFCSTLDDFVNDHRSFIDKQREPSVWIHGASAAYSRKIFDEFGPVPDGIIQEDGVMSFRALLLGNIQYIESPLMKYRVHENSVSSQTNYENVIKLQTNEYLYIRQQLSDAKKMEADCVVVDKIKRLLIIAYIKRGLFCVPYLNIYLLKAIKHRHSK